MGQEDVSVVVAVPVASEHGGNLVFPVGLVETLRMSDVVVVGDTTVFCHFLMIGLDEQMCLIAIAHITAPHGVVEVGRTLICLESASVDIVELESNTYAFAGINGKKSLEVILAIGAVAAVVIDKIGDGRQSIGEMELIGPSDEEVIRVSKHKITVRTPVGEYAVDAGRPEVAERIVLPSSSRSEDRVHEHVVECVGYGSRAVAKTFVHSPNLQSFGYFLMLALYAVASPVIAALFGRSKFTVVGQLVVILRRSGHSSSPKQSQCEKFFHSNV